MKKMGKNGQWYWQGGRDLPSTAIFTWAFCTAIFTCWQQRGPSDEELTPDIVQLPEAVDKMILIDDSEHSEEDGVVLICSESEDDVSFQ